MGIMEGTFDDDRYLDAGYETFDDWISDQSDPLDQYEYEGEEILTNKIHINNFVLKNCTKSSCDGLLVLKIDPISQIFFWGCTSFPHCKSSSAIYSNIQTLTLCSECGSNMKIGIINSLANFSFICPKCNHLTNICIEDYLEDNSNHFQENGLEDIPF